MVVAERPSRFSPEERGIPLPPEFLRRLAVGLKQVKTMEEGIEVRRRIAEEARLLAKNQSLIVEVKEKTLAIGALEERLSDQEEEIRQKDRRIAQLEAEIESTKNSPSPLPLVPAEPTTKRAIEKESKPINWQERIKGFLGNILGKRRPPVVRSRLLNVHKLDQLLQSPGGMEKIQEIVKAAEEEEKRQRLLQAQARNRRKQFAHSLAAFLVLGPLLAGSGAPTSSPSTGKENRQSRQGEITLYSALEMEKGCGKSETPVPSPEPVEKKQLSLPPATVMPGLRVEKIVSKPSIEVVIPKKGWFWKAAEPQITNWLSANGYINWVNEENGVKLSDVITKILVEKLKAEGVDFQRLSPGQRFTIDLGGNEKVVKVAQTLSLEDYCQRQANR